MYTWGTRSDPSALLHPMLNHLHITLEGYELTYGLEPSTAGKMEQWLPLKIENDALPGIQNTWVCQNVNFPFWILRSISKMASEISVLRIGMLSLALNHRLIRK